MEPAEHLFPIVLFFFCCWVKRQQHLFTSNNTKFNKTCWGSLGNKSKRLDLESWWKEQQRRESSLRSEAPTVGFVESRACWDAAPSFLLLFLIWNQKMIETQAAITPAQNTGLKQFKAKRKLIWCAKKSLINWGRTSVLSVRRGPTSVWCPAHDERNALQTRRLLTAFTYTHTEEETQITAGEAHLYTNASI